MYVVLGPNKMAPTDSDRNVQLMHAWSILSAGTKLPARHAADL